MINRLLTSCLAVGLCATAGLAQRDGTAPDPQEMAERRVNFLARQLNLTDAQKTSATTIYLNAYTASQSIQSNLKTNRESIAEAVKSNNTASIDSLALTAGTLTGQLTAINSKANAAFYALLTADQKTKYDSLPGGGLGGPGGPGRPGFRGLREQ